MRLTIVEAWEVYNIMQLIGGKIMNRVDDFIEKENQVTSDHNATDVDFLSLEKEYLEICADDDIPFGEKSRIWFKSRYEVVDMMCSGIRYFNGEDD